MRKQNATNSADMKAGNLRLILNLIRRNPGSRAELARLTGLTRAAVTLLVDELLDQGILLEIGTIAAGYGRKPMLLDLNPRRFYAVGIALARDSCHIGLADFKGCPLVRNSLDLSGCPDADASLARIFRAVDEMIRAAAVPADRLLGVGISMPGPIDIYSGTVLNPPNFTLWHQIGITRAFEAYFHLPALLENNAASLALAEKNYGCGSAFKSFMLLVIDSGIGAGIMIDRQLYRGVGGFGSEVGHMTVDLNGPLCDCGNRGCLELYASAPAILAQVNRNGQAAGSWQELADLADAGSRICQEAIELEARRLTAGIVNAMNMLELEAVILAGDVTGNPGRLLEAIRRTVRQTAMTRDIHTLSVLSSALGQSYDILSAAAIVFERYFTEGESRKQ